MLIHFLNQPYCASNEPITNAELIALFMVVTLLGFFMGRAKR